MLAVRFTFPAGRYHANPWGRHVNEGEVAWPPDPWRILRALIATWHYKIKAAGGFDESLRDERLLAGLIESLASEQPEYQLPPANHSHTRHYLPQWKAGSTALVFDAFAVLDRAQPLFAVWPNVALPAAQQHLLDTLLENLGYLGRAESWVEAQRVDERIETNCKPGDDPVDRASGALTGEVVQLHSPISAEQYAVWRQPFLTDKKQAKKLAKTLPESLLDALSLTTADLQKQGWSQAPASRQVSYLRLVDALRPQRSSRHPTQPRATSACFLLLGKPLPRVEDSVRIGELVRLALIRRAGQCLGDAAVPAVFSGHDLPPGNRHAHGFFLPFDTDGDGKLDRVMIHVAAGFEGQARRIVEDLRKIWQRGGGEWRLVLEGSGGLEVAPELTAPAATWESITPYLHPWHRKKRFTVEDQIRRECELRDWPEVASLHQLRRIAVARGRQSSPLRFHRFRGRRGLKQPDRQGSFWRIRFSRPIGGPVALGFASHFGLGLFRPLD
ncbi:MAG: type I-U CRISPR-associated protein Cas5/Cas6 [Gammaproteobacteria bacterium]|nr:type I-U CRISPR-associated protein Cas5/Cas6 [Gammaproteobacteria bacterium]